MNKIYKTEKYNKNETRFNCGMLNNNSEIIECNKTPVHFFGYSDKKEFSDNFFGNSPQFQPCGTESKRKSYEIIEKAVKNGYYSCEWIHLSPQGERIPCEIFLVRIEQQSGDYIIAAHINTNGFK